jgi:hypothetical protein
MVIRYTCEKCTSVLKISDDLAGTDGKCPKCKVKFKVPASTQGADEAEDEVQPDSPGAGVESASTEQAEIAAAVAKLVDMPTEVTPQVDLSAMDDFEPVVAGSEADNAAFQQNDPNAAPEAPKPSVAELMRAHEEAKKKKAAAKKKDKGSLEAAAAAADVMTAGTAASALTRTYDKKRSGSSDEPTLTRDERRQVEQRDAAITYAKKAVPALAGMLVFGYFLFRWAFATPLPDLEYVTGVVTRANAPLVGVVVRFAPLPLSGGTLENATPSEGITDEDGKYVLKYDPDNDGVLPGNHEVSISTISGAVYPMAAQDQKKTVSSDSTTFNFNL